MTTPPPAWAAHLPPGTDPGSVDLGAGGTLPRAWARLWAGEPGRPVLLDAGTTHWVTRGELADRTARAAANLSGAGLMPGDRLLVSAGTSIDLVVTILGALRLGLVVLPVNTAYRQAELAHIVRDARPVAAVVDDAERGRWAQIASAQRLAVLDPALIGTDPGAGFLDRAAPEDPALLLYTSGTTGAPKGALLSQGNLLAGTAALRLAWRLSPDDRLLLALPLFHVHGLVAGLFATLLSGGSAVLYPSFDAHTVLAAIPGQGASLLLGVPTMWNRIAASDLVGELRRLRLCVSGSAPLQPSVAEAIEARGGRRILERYGMTETLFTVSNPYDGERRPGSVGLPLPGVEVRLADPGGEASELHVRGPGVFGGYFGMDAGESGLDRDGWFATGDLARFDDDGYVRIEGRTRELIISGGYNVYPREVEEVLLTHPNVAEVAVVGTPSDEWGEVVTAVVVPDGHPPTVEELRAFVGDRLASFKHPRLVRHLDELPRNAMGKVLKHQLRR
jgi:malonyl-CoA/methylmalonyl-CoA synthetase